MKLKVSGEISSVASEDEEFDMFKAIDTVAPLADEYERFKDIV